MPSYVPFHRLSDRLLLLTHAVFSAYFQMLQYGVAGRLSRRYSTKWNSNGFTWLLTRFPDILRSETFQLERNKIARRNGGFYSYSRRNRNLGSFSCTSKFIIQSPFIFLYTFVFHLTEL